MYIWYNIYKNREGKLEGKIEVAKKLLKMGLSIEEVLEITELDIEKIKDLKDS